MTTNATTTEQTQERMTPRQQSQSQVPALAGPRLPYHPAIAERFGIDKASWKALVEAIFPNATSVESVILALSYCRARKLDPFKRNVHIVPIWNKEAGCLIDTIWPGIGELRTTAFRTGEYAGRGETVFGPTLSQKVGSASLSFPEWAQVTVYRMVKGERVAFAGPKVYWLETYATQKRNDDTPNDMWQTRPFGQADKCAEAAALRAGFPEEIGGDYIPEEIQRGNKGPAIDASAKPAQTLDDLTARLEGPKDSEEGDAQRSEPVGATSQVGGDEGEEAGGETNEAKTETNDAKPETTTQAADTSDLLTELDSALAACTLLSRVGKHEEEFRARTRDEVLKLEISNRCDAHRLKLKAAAGKTGNKQGTLAGAT